MSRSLQRQRPRLLSSRSRIWVLDLGRFMASFTFWSARIRKIPAWLGEAKAFWQLCVGLMAACLVGDWAGLCFGDGASRQDKIRYSGWILDVLGVIAIVWGLSGKLEQLRGQTLMRYLCQGISAWFERFPLLKRDARVVAGGAAVIASPGTLSASGHVSVGNDAPLEEKVAWLLDESKRLSRRIIEAEKAQKNQEAETRSKLRELEASIVDRMSKVEAKSGELIVGDLDKELVGLVWVFLGITFATIPEAIEWLFSWLIATFKSLGPAVLWFLPCS